LPVETTMNQHPLAGRFAQNPSQADCVTEWG